MKVKVDKTHELDIEPTRNSWFKKIPVEYREEIMSMADVDL